MKTFAFVNNVTSEEIELEAEEVITLIDENKYLTVIRFGETIAEFNKDYFSYYEIDTFQYVESATGKKRITLLKDYSHLTEYQQLKNK